MIQLNKNSVDRTRSQNCPEVDQFSAYFDQSNLTITQLQIWFGQKLIADNPLYNCCARYTIHEAIDVAKFRQAFQYLIQADPGLRVEFFEKDGVPYQRFKEQFNYEVQYIDCSTQENPKDFAQQWIDQQSQTVIPLKQRTFESALLKIHDEQFIWFTKHHHIITDGWSQVLLYNRLSELYQKFLQGQPDLKQYDSFEPYVDDERRYRNSLRCQKDQMYWENQLKSKREVLSFYGKESSHQTTATRLCSINIDFDLIQKIDFLGKDLNSQNQTNHAKRFYFFLAVYALFLYRISGKKMITIGVPIHNRRSQATKDTSGLFMNITPLRIEINPQDTVRAIIHKIMSLSKEAIKHGQYVVQNSPRDPVYEVMFNYQNGDGPNFNQAKTDVQWVHSGHAYEQLAVNIYDFNPDATGKEHMTMDFIFNKELFSDDLQNQAIKHYVHLLNQSIKYYYQPIESMGLLSQQEQRPFLLKKKNSQRSYSSLSIHQRFEEQVRKTPEAIALSFGNNQLTYAQLNQRANQIARYLDKLGVGSDILVGLCCSSLEQMIISILAVLKSGGAYVPLDPRYPKDRLALMSLSAPIDIFLTDQREYNEIFPRGEKIICLPQGRKTYKFRGKRKS